MEIVEDLIYNAVPDLENQNIIKFWISLIRFHSDFDLTIIKAINYCK